MNNALAVGWVVMLDMYRRKDFYVLFVLTALVTLILWSMNFFNDTAIVRYLKDGCLLLIWISSLVIAITMSARQIPAERESRTIFPLLAKPVTRGQLIAGKFCGCWAACGLSLLMFYFFFAVIGASREHSLPFVQYLQALWLHWICLGIVVAMALLGSVIFSAPSSNITISFVVVLGILFAGQQLNRFAAGMGGIAGMIVYALYFLIPQLGFYDVRELVVHDWQPIAGYAMVGATLYGAAYVALLLAAAWVVFRRRPLTL